MSDRSRIFGGVDPEFAWCLHCERAYRFEDRRFVGGYEMCAYDDCDGDAVMDAWDWERAREWHDFYPKVPSHGATYPMYPEELGRWVQSRRHPDRCDRGGCDNFVGSGSGWCWRWDGLEGSRAFEWCRGCAENSAGCWDDAKGRHFFVIGSPPGERAASAERSEVCSS